MRKLYWLLFGMILTGWMAHVALAADAFAMRHAKHTYVQDCANCHGADGKGDGPGAAILDPKPRDFANCKDMSKRSDAELFKAISQGGVAVGLSGEMQPWGDQLSEQQIHELIKYVRAFCKTS